MNNRGTSAFKLSVAAVAASLSLLTPTPSLVLPVAEAVHFFKTHKQESIQIMAKYTRGAKPKVLEGSWGAYKELLEDDTYPTLEGLNDTLAVQANWDPKAAKAKAEDFVDLRFVDQLKKSGLLDKLYGRRSQEPELRRLENYRGAKERRIT
jgi:hypothetical protein